MKKIIEAIATANGSARTEIVIIAIIGTTRNVIKKMKSPCLRPRFRFDFVVRPILPGFCGLTPPVNSNSAVPVSKKPHLEQ